MNILLNEILAQADPSQVEGLSRFFKTGPGQYGEGDKFLGIKVPVTREVVKKCWRELGTPWDGHSCGFPELEECIASEYHEVRLAALLSLVEIFKHAKRPARSASGSGHPQQQQCIDFYLAHTDRINNWDLVDLSCYPLLGEWLMDKDRGILYDLARHGRTLWEQRIGIVSTMTFVRHGQLADTFAIADILLHHPHDLIHKAVGWLLREAGKKDKSALEAYLQGSDPGKAPGDTKEDTPSRAPGDTCGNAPGDTKMDTPSNESGDTCGEAQGDTQVDTPNNESGDTPGDTPGDTHTSTPRPRYLTMPRTALRYAIEKFPEAERQAYLSK